MAPFGSGLVVFARQIYFCKLMRRRRLESVARARFRDFLRGVEASESLVGNVRRQDINAEQARLLNMLMQANAK